MRHTDETWVVETGVNPPVYVKLKNYKNEKKEPCASSMAAGSPVDPTLEGNREMAGRENGMQEPAGTFGHEHRPCFRRLSLF